MKIAKIAKPVQMPAIVTPLYQQLLVLIPLLKVIEESRSSDVSRVAPLRLDMTHRASGHTTIALRETLASGEVADNPEMTVAIYTSTPKASAVTYQDAFIFAWSYLSGGASMHAPEHQPMYELFRTARIKYVIRHQQTIEEMGLA